MSPNLTFAVFLATHFLIGPVFLWQIKWIIDSNLAAASKKLEKCYESHFRSLFRYFLHLSRSSEGIDIFSITGVKFMAIWGDLFRKVYVPLKHVNNIYIPWLDIWMGTISDLFLQLLKKNSNLKSGSIFSVNKTFLIRTFLLKLNPERCRSGP